MSSPPPQPPSNPPPSSPSPSSSSSSPTTAPAPAPSLGGRGAPAMTCPQIRRSHCNFYLWREAATATAPAPAAGCRGRHVETPCPFTFVSERAYLAHCALVHRFGLAFLAPWYTQRDHHDHHGSSSSSSDVGGRLPRYAPAPLAGAHVVDRRVRDDPLRMYRRLRRFYAEDEGGREKQGVEEEEEDEGQAEPVAPGGPLGSAERLCVRTSVPRRQEQDSSVEKDVVTSMTRDS